MKGAFYTKEYRNVFAEYGYSEQEIEKKIKDSFQTCFFKDGEKFYFEEDGFGYFEDTGNLDVRTEGMSYAMMMCVQMNMKKEFDRVWKYCKERMFLTEGWNKGYFIWHCKPDGEITDVQPGPASDGEEFFAMALFFASHRWADGEGIYNYSKEARELLHTCLHKGEDIEGTPMWEPENYLIKFIPSENFTDPSYHCPHFYELFALWANEEDRPFWKRAAAASREYWKLSCHKETGMSPEYAYYDGTPYEVINESYGGVSHGVYYSDSYRTVANIGLDYEWFAPDEWHIENNNRIQKFFMETHRDEDFMTYTIDGTVLDQPALHPVAIIATNAMASLAADGK
ncbi:MAG: xylanase, partial [Lachnoclostridium sp.]|nr:xylanase [Lachnoclostridium sp.]